MTKKQVHFSYYFLAVLIQLNCALVFGQAKKTLTAGTKSAVPKTTAPNQGKAIGETVTKVIGVGGDNFTSEDELLTVSVPAGALLSETEIGIQLIENTNPATFGFSYRLTPHNITFNKPVTLSFKYEDELLDKIDPSILFISTFVKGKWMAMAGNINKEKKTISFETSHFSDWSMGNSIKITPRYQLLADRESSLLEILDYGIEQQKLKEGKAIPVQAPKRIDEKMVKNWELFGQGDLMPYKAIATYTAPNSNADPVTDEIVATINYQKGTLLLYAWVRTLRPGVYFEADGKEYFFPGVTQWANGYISDQSVYGSFSIKIHGETVSSTGNWSWKNQGDKPTTFSFDTPADADGHYISYTSYHFPSEHSEQKNSNGKINIFYFGPYDDYVSGRFIIINAGKFISNSNTITGKAMIKGYFRIYHWKENKF